MGLRELKELAHQQYVRGKFAQCAQTYHQILRLAPRDPNMRVRHAEACRRAGERLQAIASYRAAADLLLELGCESRARGALKAALELDPQDATLQAEVARLEPQALSHDEAFATGASERTEESLPLFDSGLDPVPPPPPTAPRFDPRARAASIRKPALPPIHRALPSMPSVAPLVPPVLLPAPSGPALPPHPATPSAQAQASRPVTESRPAPVMPAPTPSPRAPAQAAQGALIPPPPPAEAFLEDSAEVPSVVISPELLADMPAPSPQTRVEIRRLSPNVLAFRCSPTDSWALIRSKTPLEMHLVEDLAKLPAAPRDFSLDITVEPAAEMAPSPVN